MKRMIVLPTLLALAVLAAACGGSGADAGVASLADDAADISGEIADESEAVEEISNEDAVLAFTACLRDQGVDIDDPEVDADGNIRPPRPRNVQGMDPETMRAAFDSCSDHLESVAFGFRSEDRTEREDQMLEFAACVRDNGYDMPDPDFSGSGEPGQGGGPLGSIDPEDPAFQSAAEACSDIFGAGQPIPGTGRRSG